MDEEYVEQTAPLLINDSELSTEAVRQALAALMRTPAWILLRVLYGLLLATGFYLVAQGLLGRGSQGGIALGIGLVGVSLWMYVQKILREPARRAKAWALKQAGQGQQIPIARQYRLYEDQVVRLTRDEEPLELPYAELAQVLPTADYLVLCTTAKRLLVLRRQGFTQGSEEEFWALLTRVRPKAVPKKYRT